ncbi:hypothetical protein LSH36_676g01027 [Paralvinella palmiformis]|uniref:Laminin EGF-like domain-containing protein n=1 Tax=Paralvinella palmiformis TaxID=53620 RepID=A0AAD9J3M5_9ANNE|nr:hypothetical protein LSH36_676g01027 [Paralvinella palmiformis]
MTILKQLHRAITVTVLDQQPTVVAYLDIVALKFPPDKLTFYTSDVFLFQPTASLAARTVDVFNPKNVCVISAGEETTVQVSVRANFGDKTVVIIVLVSMGRSVNQRQDHVFVLQVIKEGTVRIYVLVALMAYTVIRHVNVRMVQHVITCEQQCPPGYYGTTCRETCQCTNGAVCVHTDGSCICDGTGYEGLLCDNRMCPLDKFGVKCSETCKCRKETTEECHAVTGQCKCKPGWTGSDCSATCPDQFYGRHCSQRCDCEHAVGCNHVTGQCRCKAGYIGKRCSQQCPEGYHGDNCTELCDCKNSISCDHRDGHCSCKPGNVRFNPARVGHIQCLCN